MVPSRFEVCANLEGPPFARVILASTVESEGDPVGSNSIERTSRPDRLSLRGIIALGVIALGARVGHTDILRVPADHATIQEALDVAADGDTILVAPGEYVITNPLSFNRFHDPLDATSPALKDLELRSESGADATVIRMHDEPDDPDEASVFVFEKGESNRSFVEGFTVTGGQGRLATSVSCFFCYGPQRQGGGFLIRDRSAVRIASCAITGNFTRIQENTSHVGGGLYVENSIVEITESEISANVGDWGAAVFMTDSDVSLATVRILANHNRGWVPMAQFGNCELRISDCLVADNYSQAGGVNIWGANPASIDRLTIAGNLFRDAPIYLSVPAELENSIIWGNLHRPPIDFSEAVDVHHSCIQNRAPRLGETVIDQDPEFCAWGDLESLRVDDDAAPGGDGTPERPFDSLRDALRYGYGLGATSPCRTAGEDGGPIGAELESCETAGRDRTRIVLEPGDYELPIVPLGQNVSIHGSDAQATTVRGTLVGARPGAEIRDITIAEGPSGGVWIGEMTIAEPPVVMESVDIRRCRANGGVVVQNANLTMRACRVVDNSADWTLGSAVWHSGGAIKMEDSLIAGNRFLSGSGALTVSGVAPSVDLNRVTIAGNWTPSGTGLLIGNGQVTMKNSIVWGNASSEDIRLSGGVLDAEYSCLPEPFARGKENISVDPLFCGWGRESLHVDAAAPVGGDGSAERPLRSFDAGLGYNWALADASPCRGSGENGVDRGWSAPSCGDRGPAELSIDIAAGRYRLDASFPGPVRIEGAGADQTTIAGGIAELSGTSSLRDLAVEGTVYVAREASATIENSVLSGGSSTALVCRAGSDPLISDTTFRDGSANAITCESTSRPVFQGIEVRGYVGVALISQEATIELVDSSILANGGGLSLNSGSATITRCLIARNSGCPISSQRTQLTVAQTTIARNYGAFSCTVTASGETTIRDSIIWGNTEKSLLSAANATVSYSCVEGELVPGEGNLNLDPAFCGLGAADEMWVDANAPAGGDGSRETPFTHPNAATEFSFALAEGSPCLGAGTDGGDIGIPFEPCATTGADARTIHLASGDYSGPIVLGSGIDLVGAGSGETVIHGGIADLRGGVSNLRVDGSDADGILVSTGASAHIERVFVVGAARSGIVCGPNSNVVVESSVFDDNGEAGIACWEGAQIEVHHTTIARSAGFPGRHGSRFGGGFYAASLVKATLTHCLLERNDVSGIFAGNGDEISIVACEVTANNQSGIQAHNGKLQLTDSLIAGNHSYDGTALTGGNLTVEMIGCTVTENRSGPGDDRTQAIVLHNSEFTLRNSIVWGNGLGASIMHYRNEDPPQGFTKVTSSLVEGELPEHAELADVINADPLFHARGEGDGAAWERGDYRLQPSSPAIDVGSMPVPTSVDLVGRARVCGPLVDLGAYEYCTSPFRRSDANLDGASNIADPIFVLGFLFEDGAALDCAAAADVNADDSLNIADPIYHLNYLFGDGSPPPPPFEECGETSPEQMLDCEIFPGCE